MLRKLLFGFVLSAMLISGLPSSFSTEIGDSPQWLMPAPDENIPSRGVVFMEPTIYPGSVSSLQSWEIRNETTSASDWSPHMCKSLASTACTQGNPIDYVAYIPKCLSNESNNCIDQVWAVIDGKKVFGELNSYMPADAATSFIGDSSKNLPEGKGSSFWKIPGLKNSGGTELVSVSIILNGNYSPKLGSSTFSIRDISATIDPVSIKTGSYRYPYINTRATESRGFVLDGCLNAACTFGVQNGICAAIDNGSCAARESVSPEIRMGVSVKLKNAPKGWIHGRIDSPDFLITKNESGQIWKIEGAPVRIPVLGGWVSNESATALFNSRIPNMQQTSWTGPLNSGMFALDQSAKWLPVLGDKASATQSRWSFRTLEFGDARAVEATNASTGKSCVDGIDVIGQISTNSMVYQGEPPAWDPVTQTLDYKVSSPHRLSDGSLFKGNYDLRISKEFAQCFYRLNNIPISATVTIVNDSGENQVGTTTVSTDANWLHLQATGFTFSSPTLKVKFVTEAPKNQAPIVSKQTIQTNRVSCKKGKTIKILKFGVTKCPKGYTKVK